MELQVTRMCFIGDCMIALTEIWMLCPSSTAMVIAKGGLSNIIWDELDGNRDFSWKLWEAITSRYESEVKTSTKHWPDNFGNQAPSAKTAVQWTG